VVEARTDDGEQKVSQKERVVVVVVRLLVLDKVAIKDGLAVAAFKAASGPSNRKI
jgi:hypothetical protein